MTSAAGSAAPRRDRVLLGAVARDRLAEGRRELPFAARGRAALRRAGRRAGRSWSSAGGVFSWARRRLGLRGASRSRGLLVAALMLPMLSNDVFSLFAYGSLAAQGHDVYTTAAGLTDTVWYPWVGQHWNEKVCVYGPSTLVGILPVALGRPQSVACPARPPPRLVRTARARHGALVPATGGPAALSRDGVAQSALGRGGARAAARGPARARRPSWRGSSCASAGARSPAGRSTRWRSLGKYSFAFTGFWFWLFGARTARAAPAAAPGPWRPSSPQWPSSSSRRSGGARPR